MARPHHPSRARPFVRLFVAVVLLGAGWWGYRLLWSRPLNIDHFFDRIFVENMIHYPQALSQTGLVENGWLDFHSGKLNDASPDASDWRIERARQNLAVLQGYDLASLSPEQLLSAEIMAWTLDDQIRGAAFRYHNYPVNQLSGEQSDLPDFMVQIHRIADRRSAERYIERLRAFAPHFDQLLASLRLREDKGIVPPRFVVTKVLAEMKGFTAKSPAENLLYVNLADKLGKLDNVSAADKTTLLDEATHAIEEQVYPAYAKLTEYEAGLETRARTTDGVWALPDGDAYYAWRLREQTTSDQTPEEIHQFGLAEVTRIEAELTPLLDTIGVAPGPVGTRIATLTADPKYLFPNTEEGRAAILDRYRQILADMKAKLPEDFSQLPKAQLLVAAVPAFKAPTAPGAYYQGPSLDGARPGTFFANVYNTAATQTWSMKTLAFHEGIPGHHLQISIRAETPGLPYFRKTARFTAYTEGWALYAEHLVD
jgi:uncharacterized protein (DUF885 family)